MHIGNSSQSQCHRRRTKIEERRCKSAVVTGEAKHVFAPLWRLASGVHDVLTSDQFLWASYICLLRLEHVAPVSQCTKCCVPFGFPFCVHFSISIQYVCMVVSCIHIFLTSVRCLFNFAAAANRNVNCGVL